MNILGIDLGSTQTCAVLAQTNGDELKIIGYGKTKTQGIKKGAIIDMTLAAKSIERAVLNVEVMSGVKRYDKIVVSISGAYTKGINSQGVVNVNSEISIQEIRRAVTLAEHNASIPNDYETIQILPYSFQVNDTDCVIDPLGMNAKRLVVLAHIIIAKKSDIKNLKKVVELAGLKADNLVLSGYASAIACLSDSEKELGAILIDMGGGICDIVVYMGNSIHFQHRFLIGSSNITADLAQTLHTPLSEAENIKLSWEDLGEPKSIVQVPLMGDERKVRDYAVELISDIIYSRVNETLLGLAEWISAENAAKNAGAGVVLTGGFVKLARFDEVAAAAFSDKSTRVASANDGIVSNFTELFDPENSCAIGLCLYEAGHFTPYEIDSSKKLRFKGEELELSSKPTFTPIGGEESEYEDLQEDSGTEVAKDFSNLPEPKKEKRNVLVRLWDKLSNQF